MENIIVKNLVIVISYFLIYIYALRYIQCYSWGALKMINIYVYKMFSMIGAPAHELSHALAAIIFGFRITNINIFKHVNFMVPSNFRGIIGSFVVSIAPALFNITIFTIICYKNNNIYFNFVMFLILISCIAPSNSDIKGMLPTIIIGIIVIVFTTYALGRVLPSINVYIKNSILLVGKFYALYISLLTIIVTIKECIINKTINPFYILNLYKNLIVNGLTIMRKAS